MAPAGCRRFSSRGERARQGCSVGFVLCPLLDRWSTSLLGEDSGERGSDTVTWVGFELLHSTYHLGISARRAAWFIRWTEEVVRASTINTASSEEGLGRVMYAAGALEHERPVLLPLWHPRGVVRTVPTYVSYLSRGLTDEALQLSDGDSLMTDSAAGGRPTKRRSYGDRRLGTSA